MTKYRVVLVIEARSVGDAYTKVLYNGGEDEMPDVLDMAVTEVGNF